MVQHYLLQHNQVILTFVGNNSANSINVWPATGFYIGSAAQNAALAVGAGKTAKFIALGTGNWIAILSA